jgi:hypothetical protein
MIAGRKTHDIRLNDRDYAVGDQLLLQEYDAIGETGYTGREAVFDITYITGHKAAPCAVSTAVLPKEYVVLSVKLLAVSSNGNSLVTGL